MNDEIVSRRRVLQHLIERSIEPSSRSAARGHSLQRQAYVVARFRVHLIHERLVVQEVDFDRSGRLDRFRT